MVPIDVPQRFLHLMAHDAPSSRVSVCALFKLQQKGTVTDYLTDFERLANRIFGLALTFLSSCLISGLTWELLREVQAHQPPSLT